MAKVHAGLIRQEAACVLVDQREVLQTEVDITFGASVEGIIRVGETTIDLSSVKAVYLRSYGIDQLPALRGGVTVRARNGYTPPT
jgi:hypothetical protein